MKPLSWRRLMSWTDWWAEELHRGARGGAAEAEDSHCKHWQLIIESFVKVSVTSHGISKASGSYPHSCAAKMLNTPCITLLMLLRSTWNRQTNTCIYEDWTLEGIQLLVHWCVFHREPRTLRSGFCVCQRRTRVWSRVWASPRASCSSCQPSRPSPAPCSSRWEEEAKD